MAYVGYTGVANLANTSDGFASEVNAQNNPSVTNQFGLYTGDFGVVDLYHNGTGPVTSYILFETTGYVLEEDLFKIQLEA